MVIMATPGSSGATWIFAARLVRSDIIRAFSKSMMVSIGARVLQVIMASMLGRQLGPEGFGVFTVATGAALLVGEVAAQGWPMLMSRQIPFLTQEGQWDKLRGLLRYSGWMVMLGSLLASIGLYAFSLIFAKSEPTYSAGLALSALLAPAVAFSRLRRQQYAAFNRPGAAILIDEVCAPVGLIMAAAAIGLTSAFSSILVYTLAWGAAVVAGALVFRRTWPTELRAASPAGSFAAWSVTAFGGLTATVSRLAMTKVDILMLAPIVSFHDAGIYSAALRITYVLTFPQVVLMTVLTPRLSSAYWTENHALLRRNFLMGLAIAFISSVPCGLFLLLTPINPINLVFGRSFVNDSNLLAYLTLGQMTISLTMPFTSLLLMAGREWIVGIMYTLLLAVMIVANVILIPRFGYMGPAYTNLVINLFLAVAQFVLTYPILFGFRR